MARKIFLTIVATVLLLTSGISGATPASVSRLRAVDFVRVAGELRMTLVLDRPVTPHLFSLSHPSRLVLDFPRTRSQLRLHHSVLGRSGILQNVRVGYPRPGTLRLVLDLAGPVHYRMLAKPHSVVMHLVLSSSAISAISVMSGVRVAGMKNLKSLRKVIVAPAAQRSLAGPRPITVVIDPGHGGHDPGAIGFAGIREKAVVLAIARKLAAEIRKMPHMRAILTRSGDYFVPLRTRMNLARRGKADLFVAIHADSFRASSAHGASVYALSAHGASSEAARWLARRENYSELASVNLRTLPDQSNLLRSVLIDLAQAATIHDSLQLGNMLLGQLKQVSGLRYRHVGQAPFMVLKSPDIPSVLVETGFLSSHTEALRLRDPDYQARIAHSIFLGIGEYLKRNPVAAG